MKGFLGALIPIGIIAVLVGIILIFGKPPEAKTDIIKRKLASIKETIRRVPPVIKKEMIARVGAVEKAIAGNGIRRPPAVRK